MGYKNNNLITDTKLIHPTIAFFSYYIKIIICVYNRVIYTPQKDSGYKNIFT